MSQVTCSIDGCELPHVAKGYCDPHYRRWKKTGNPTCTPLRAMRPRVECAFAGCGRPDRTDGLCKAHYLQKFAGKELRPLRRQADSRIRDEQGRKRCFTCREWLPEDRYYSGARTHDGLWTVCMGCHRNANLKRTYGITQDEYDTLLAAQGGTCAVCQGTNDNGYNLYVDHDHDCCPGNRACGKCIRGLLCNTCNRVLGMFNDDPDRFRGAVAYLTGCLM